MRGNMMIETMCVQTICAALAKAFSEICVSLKALANAAARLGGHRSQVQTYVQSGLSDEIRAYNTSSCDIPIGARCFHGNGNCYQVSLMQILAASHHSCNAL